jgi:hypothetical protein
LVDVGARAYEAPERCMITAHDGIGDVTVCRLQLDDDEKKNDGD